MAPKEHWGCITKCRFPLGHQRMTNFEIMQSVDRLTMHRPRNVRAWWPDEFKHKKASKANVEKTVTRLTKGAADKVTDSKRIAAGRVLGMGVVNSFAWKGYN